MKKILLGNTGEMISCMGLGTMYLGTKIDERVSFDLLDSFISHGGTLLDTANKYASWLPGFSGGESERTLGKWIKTRCNRSGLFIASKVGFPYGDIPRSLKSDLIISECDKSLKRLGIDTIDLYFAHAFDNDTPAEETMEAFYQLRKAGKIRFAGASNYYAWQIQEANSASGRMGWEGFCSVQQRHTYLEPFLRANFNNQIVLTPETEAFCTRMNISVMAYSPLLGGIYSVTGREVPVQYQSSVNEIKLGRLMEVADELNVSANAVVLAWMMQGAPPVIPLVAGSSVAQMEENFMALELDLKTEHIDKLNQKIV